jgi:hypothetical protein
MQNLVALVPAIDVGKAKTGFFGQFQIPAVRTIDLYALLA